MTAYRSRECDLAVHSSGWVRLPSGVWITAIPVVDTGDHGPQFARGSEVIRSWAKIRGCRLATAEEYEQHHALPNAIHVAPYTLPTAAMLRRDGIRQPWADSRGRDTPQMSRYRSANMSSVEWCTQHDEAVMAMLRAQSWDGEPVPNCGKHIDHDGDIIGWWLFKLGRKKIQNESAAHRGTEQLDYATTCHLVHEGEKRPDLKRDNSAAEKPATPRESEPPTRRTLRLTIPWMRGPDVSQMQRTVGAPADGLYGPRTREMVRGWQRANGLAPDGVVGPRTWAKAQAESGPDAEVVVADQLPPISFRQAGSYYAGRRHGAPIWIVIHTAEALKHSATAENLQSWATGKIRVSWHYAVDDDTIAQSVREQHTAWAAPGANARGIQIELAGYARQTAAEWADEFSTAQLELLAKLVADICQRHSIPAVKVGPSEMLAGKPGVCGHIDVTRGVGKGRTNHSDPGSNFPWVAFMGRVRQLLGE